jgi:N-acetylglutamate synthase-like GNAT family acetyltransferase
MLRILPYTPDHQESIDQMMREIAAEFAQPISDPAYRSAPPDIYWVAMQENELAGTVALTLEKEYGVLKKMMLNKPFRGSAHGVSELLLQTAIDRCRELPLPALYLGTMEQMKAAHRFYEKNGFERITLQDLPAGFQRNPVDDVFYRILLI